MNPQSRITIDPNICHGKPTVRGLRYPVETILELLSSGMTTVEILAITKTSSAKTFWQCSPMRPGLARLTKWTRFRRLLAPDDCRLMHCRAGLQCICHCGGKELRENQSNLPCGAAARGLQCNPSANRVVA